eukprot:1133671-Ditylum_brightwellii.AAC.2
MNITKMGKKTNPSKLFEQIKSIKYQYAKLKKKMDEEDKIALVLEKAPTEYAGILASTEKEKGNNLTMVI